MKQRLSGTSKYMYFKQDTFYIQKTAKHLPNSQATHLFYDMHHSSTTNSQCMNGLKYILILASLL